jgi:sortase A
MFREDLLLKAGVIMITLALALVIVAVVVSVALRSVPEQAVASESSTKTSTKTSVEPLIRGESPYEPWVEKATPLPASDASKNESASGAAGGKLEPEPQAQRKLEPQAEPKPQAEHKAQLKPEPEQQTLPGADDDWQAPTQHEIEAANNPRHYELPAGAIMALTVEAIGIHNAPIFDSVNRGALTNGVAHVPETSLPWSPTPQRNVYLAAHRMGYRGTWSRMLFYNLDKLGRGDEVVLKDRNGKVYRYRVSEVFVTDPGESWVMGQVLGRDMVTLQTCTPYPTFEKRLIVRADRI